ncbi:MAG: SDR family NAD(P)-dependent oxidoreductase [Rickettsiales bacterium]|nr:SDR family NAD(P)-dependent oxidoreductase [Rickettsiales bacterium]
MGALDGRIALITGASRGIGAGVAEAFAREGAHVILVARDVKGLEATDDAVKAAGGTATLVPLDITDLDKIELLAASVSQRFGKLDILVGNAGVLTDLTPLPHMAPADWQKSIATNLTANWQLIRCFDAILKQSDAPRAIFVTSGVTQRPAPYWGGYAAAKAGLEAMVQLYATENAQSALRVNLIDPGAVATRMRAKAYPGEDATRLRTPADVATLFVWLASPACTETGQRICAT